MMTSEEIRELKTSIDELFASRTGANIAKTATTVGWAGANYGSLSGKSPAFSVAPIKGGPIRSEYGEKTANLLKENFYATASSNCGGKKSASEKADLQLTTVETNKPIPSDFNYSRLSKIVADLKAEKNKSNGVSANTLGKDSSGSSVEVSSCRAACSGICVGSCIGFCNSCTSCTGSCESACTSGCVNTCSATCKNSCSSGCYNTCTGTCAKTTA